MSTKKLLTLSLGLSLLFLFIAYSILWHWMANSIKEQSELFIYQASKQQIYILPKAVSVQGFPLVYEIHISANIRANEVQIIIPTLILKSYFLPGSVLKISMPEGFTIQGVPNSELWSIDWLNTKLTIPNPLPNNLTREELIIWQESDPQLLISNMSFNKGPLKVSASGTISLDKNLQPIGDMTASTQGVATFVSWLQEEMYIDMKQAFLTTTLINNLERTSAPNKTKTIPINIKLQNQTLFLGPLQVAHLPRLHWAWHNQPGLLE